MKIYSPQFLYIVTCLQYGTLNSTIPYHVYNTIRHADINVCPETLICNQPVPEQHQKSMKWEKLKSTDTFNGTKWSFSVFHQSINQ